MAREPEGLAETRRGLGAQLTVFRVAAELTQGQLAQAACCDRTNVAHIEKGRSRGDERFWTLVDELCGAEGALVAAFHAVSAAKQAHEVRIREAQLAKSRAKAQALRLTLRREADRLGITTRAGTVDGDPSPGTVKDQEMKRRDTIALAAKIAIGVSLTAADRAILDAPVTASPVPARIGAPDVARVKAVTCNLMAQDKALGGGSCRDAVLGCLSWAQQMRGANASDEVRRALDAALARLESLAGWTSRDLCLPRSAQRCYLRSLESAQRAEERVHTAHALQSLGGLHLETGHFQAALQLFRLGALPAQEAVSSGMLPDHSEFPAGRANAYSRLASHDQRFAETAVTDMTEALRLRDPGRARAMLSGRTTLATNQYRCGETDLANTSTEQVLASISQVSSRRTARDLITLGAEIRQHTTDSTALDVARRINTEIAA